MNIFHRLKRVFVQSPASCMETESISVPTASMTVAPSDEIAELKKSAALFFDAGDLVAASASYRRVVTLDTDDVEGFTCLGFVLYESGKLKEAAEALAIAVDLDPQSADACYFLAQVYRASEQVDEAVTWYGRAIEARPDFEPAVTELAKTFFKADSVDAAINVIQHAIEHSDETPGYCFLLGNLLMAKQDWCRAAKCFKRALSIRSDLPDAHLRLALALEFQGKWDEAIVNYQHAFSRQPADPAVYRRMARAREAEGQLAEALALHRLAIELDDSHVETRLDIGRLTIEKSLRDVLVEPLADSLPAQVRDIALPSGHGMHVVNLLIEGWRKINHSFALINQFQMLELLAQNDLKLFHRDIAFPAVGWNERTVGAGFSEFERASIDCVPEPEASQLIDWIYTISSPFRRPIQTLVPTMTYMVAEHGLAAVNFLPPHDGLEAYTQDKNLIVTSSTWSQARLYEYGFNADRIRVVTCGVSRKFFYPLSNSERQVQRSRLGIGAEDVVFLNLAAPFWNKGLDILMLAFAKLRKSNKHMVLVLKDQRALYGTAATMEGLIKDLAKKYPQLFTSDTLDAIKLIGSNLPPEKMRILYGVADAYVSPYRAEGFNLPVLEALACGVPVVVTDGGSTDDFCPHGVAIRVSARLHSRNSDEKGKVHRYLEPDLDAVMEAMSKFLNIRQPMELRLFEQTLLHLLPEKSWTAASLALRRLMN